MKFSGNGALQHVSLKIPTLTRPIELHSANLQFAEESVTGRGSSGIAGVGQRAILAIFEHC